MGLQNARDDVGTCGVHGPRGGLFGVEFVPMSEIPCACYDCLVARGDADAILRLQRMILCGLCGNKRCPHATNHNNVCTRSNAPGQTGSRYGGLPEECER